MMKQEWNDKSGRWEPQTNSDFIRGMTDSELAQWLSTTFCHGYGQADFLRWLRQAHEEEANGTENA